MLDSFFFNSEGKTISEGVVYASYFYNCHSTGGDYSWHANNLASAPGSPTQNQVTAAWAFDGQWDPENTLPAVLPYTSIPQPWNKAYDVSTTTQVKWIKARNAVSYNVYFGQAASPVYVANTTNNIYNPGQLTPATTYYWRVDAVTQSGTVPGTVWALTTK
jgi:hypothetical protein